MATVVRTIGTATRDYSTIQAWEDATDNNLISAKDIEQGECYNDSEFSTSAATIISGATTNASYYRRLTAASGQSFQDHADKATNALRYNQSNGVALTCSAGYASAAIDCNEDNFKLDRLQIKQTHTQDTRGLYVRNADDIITDCIVQGVTNSNGVLSTYGSGTGTKIINTLVRQTGSGKTNIAVIDGQTKHLNLTLVADSDLGTPPTNGFNSSYSNASMTNCAVFGATNLKSGAGTPTYTTCATDKTSPPSGWTGSLTYGNQFENTTAASADFRLKSGADLINAGTTDTDAANDIIGTARSSYDIGVWEFVAVGGANPKNVFGGIMFDGPFRRVVFAPHEWEVK